MHSKKKEKTEDPKKEIQELEKRIQELGKKAAERDEYYDKYVRVLAEYDNARKRIEKDATEIVKFANEAIINELFPILDSFDSAISGIEKMDKNSQFLEGFKLLQKKFHKVLEDNGLQVMTSTGEKFDPIKHEAVMRVQSDTYDDGIVAEELRKGYMLKGKVLRPAMVKVVVKDEQPEGERVNEKKERGEEESIESEDGGNGSIE